MRHAEIPDAFGARNLTLIHYKYRRRLFIPDLNKVLPDIDDFLVHAIVSCYDTVPPTTVSGLKIQTRSIMPMPQRGPDVRPKEQLTAITLHSSSAEISCSPLQSSTHYVLHVRDLYATRSYVIQTKNLTDVGAMHRSRADNIMIDSTASLSSAPWLSWLQRPTVMPIAIGRS